MDYLYDGTFEGLMTAVYYHYKKEKADNIYELSSYQQSIVFQCEIVETDISKAKLVSDAINRLISREAYIYVYYCYLSNVVDKENIILDFLIFAFKYGKNTMNFYTHEKVLPINEIYKRVAREEHRILGILRFSDIGGFLYAKYSPDNDISILIADHFADRYKYEKFIIYDEKRKKAVVYSDNNWEIKENINFDNIEFSEGEKKIQDLWKQYFTDLAIKEGKILICNFYLFQKDIEKTWLNLNYTTMVLLQEKVEADFLGRIFSVFGMISSAMMPIGMLIFGPLADYVRIEWMMLGTGILIVIRNLFLKSNKILLEAGKPVEK